MQIIDKKKRIVKGFKKRAVFAFKTQLFLLFFYWFPAFSVQAYFLFIHCILHASKNMQILVESTSEKYAYSVKLNPRKTCNFA